LSSTIAQSRGNLGSEKVAEVSLGSSRGLLGLGGVLLLQALLPDWIREREKKKVKTGSDDEVSTRRTNFLSANGLGVRVETEENSLVDKGVLLLCPGTFLNFLASGANNGLDLVAVDQASNIWVGDLGGREAERGESAKK